MAAYNTRFKVIVNDTNVAADTVAGSWAKEVNDYVQTLDATTGEILQMGSFPLGGGGKVCTWILHKG